MRTFLSKGKKWICLMAVAGLCLGLLTGCGDGITDETASIVTEKTDTALALYADIEKMVQEHSLTADESFAVMKTKLTDMSAKIRENISDTTEEDGKLAITELDAMIKNLTEVKESVRKMVNGGTQ